MSEEEKRPESKPGWKKNVVLYLHDIIWYLTIICVVLLLFFRIVVVSGTSMNWTLYDGDYLVLLSNLFYQHPKSGDIVVISKDSFESGTPIVKRVIATEGQKVDIDFVTGTVYVDDEPIEEGYIKAPTTTSGGMQFPLTVEEGCVFVLGDNRNNSRDSRFLEIGLVDEREILGKAFFLLLPGTNGTDAMGNPLMPRDYSRIGALS